MPVTRDKLPDKWWHSSPRNLENCLAILQTDYAIAHLKDPTEEGRQLRKIYRRIQQESKAIAQRARQQNPLAFLKVSWEQALKLNAWVWGITLSIDFDANRKGKTANTIFNALLWMFPNDPNWQLFSQPYEDPWQRYVSVIPRPTLRNVLGIQKYLDKHPELAGDPNCQPYDTTSGNAQKFATLQAQIPKLYSPCFPSPPIDDRINVLWQGSPDVDYHKNIIMPAWRKWLPKASIARDSEYDKKMTLCVAHPQNPNEQFTWDIIFKSYEAKDEKWSGEAVKGILLTEGLKPSHLNEIKQRFMEDGFGSWDYTPYEPRNTGSKVALAYKVFRGQEPLPLKPYVFTGFGIEKTPDFILPDQKKADLIRMWENKPEGQARIKGLFYSSSPVVLSNLDPQFHCVSWSKEELFDRFPDGRLYRGLDPGYDHPTCAVWALLNKTNTWFIYRVFSESNLSLGQRCQKIIQLSGNARQKRKFGPGEDDYYYEETHPNPTSERCILTIADWHTFKADERTKQPYATNYTREGLVLVPSVTLGPRERAQQFDKKLEPDLFRPHPVTKTPPGAKVYFLNLETGVAAALEKLSNIFWARYLTGDRKGDPKDEVQEHEDDEFDAISYVVCSPYRWSSYVPPRHEPKENETTMQRLFAILQ